MGLTKDKPDKEKRPTLKAGDDVLVIDLETHKAKVDKVDKVTNKKVELKKDKDKFDDKGNKENDTKKRLLKLKPHHIATLTASAYINGIDSITNIDIPQAVIDRWDLENEKNP